MKIIALIVTYKPKKEQVKSCINSLISQVSEIVVVNNDSSPISWINNTEKIKIIELGENFGIAYAQNIGIEYSLDKGYDYVLLSDQDTVFPDDYVFKMEKAILDNKRYKVAVFSPYFFDLTKNEYQTLMKNKFDSFSCDNSKSYYEVEHVIASGMVIPREVLEDVGKMDENLFIDWVDNEWCWRAKDKGYKIITCSNIIIKHNLGDTPKVFCGKKYTLRSAIRYYYIVRNASYLKNSLYFSSNDKRRMKIRIFKMICGIIILTRFNHKNIRYVKMALYDAKHLRMGKFNSDNFWSDV